MKIEIALKSGIKVDIEAFHFQNTYGEILVGIPSEELNKDIIDNVKYPFDWGTRKSIVRANDIYVGSDSKILKPYLCNVWLSSSVTIDDQLNYFDGSQLIISFLVKSVADKTLEEIIKTEIFNLDWNRYAENYQI